MEKTRHLKFVFSDRNLRRLRSRHLQSMCRRLGEMGLVEPARAAIVVHWHQPWNGVGQLKAGRGAI